LKHIYRQEILERAIMETTPTKTSQPPKRHWCFTAWLICAVLASIILAVLTPFGLIYFPANMVMIIALYKWRRWGFTGFAIIVTVTFVLKLTNGVDLFKSALSFVSLAILYVVLQIGGDKKAWKYLK